MSFTVTYYDSEETVLKDASENQVIQYLIDKGDRDYQYQVTEWDDEELEADGTPLMLEQLAGDEWLDNNL